jgi:hypothetical protein
VLGNFGTGQTPGWFGRREGGGAKKEGRRGEESMDKLVSHPLEGLSILNLPIDFRRPNACNL